MTTSVRLLEEASAELSPMLDLLRDLVLCESPSEDPTALNACADLLADAGSAALGRAPERVVLAGVTHLLWRPKGPAPLLLGHYDTVWALGTLAELPFSIEAGIARGPGVFDMKAGIVQMLQAARLCSARGEVGLLLTADEETGSVNSRPLVEEVAATAPAVLVGEPSGADGAVKIARKGMAAYRLRVQGHAAHAGLEPERGVNATIELAHQILAVQPVQRPDAGTTATPTIASSGATRNTVPELAHLYVDVRAWTRAELDRVDAHMRALTPTVSGAELVVDGEVNRYPMEEAMSRDLFDHVREAAREIGVRPRSRCARAAAPTATSPRRSAYPPWTASARSAATRTPGTSSSTSPRCPPERPCSRR